MPKFQAQAGVPIYVSNDAGFNPKNAASILPITQPVFSSPISVINQALVLKQDYWCFRSKYQPLPLNTAHPDFADFILVNESERLDQGGDVVRWTRTYAKIPPTYSLASSMTYSFIGFLAVSGINVPVSTGRPRFSDIAAARVQHDYFLIDGNAYKSPVDIPIIDQQFYYANAQVVSLNIFTDFLTSVATTNQPTVPSVEDYLAWVKNKIEIVAIGSTIRNWMGNIIERQTTYILPQ